MTTLQKSTSEMGLMLELAIEEHHVDANRLYVTGISLGGSGAWNIIDRYPDRFAAAVPIVGASVVDPENVLDQAIWAFHPRDDFPSGTRSVIHSILTAASEPLPTFPPLHDSTTDYHFDSQLLDLHYTEPAAGGHGYFVTVYAHERMYDWMFAHGVVPEPSSLALLIVAAWILNGPLMRYVTTLSCWDFLCGPASAETSASGRQNLPYQVRSGKRGSN